LLTRVKWRPDAESDQEINIDIISVHLDFSRQTVREKQIAEIRELLIARDNPLIILGDFNSDWFTEKSVIKMLA
ncbi:[weak similarity to] endonuclease/exonuclease/phosphatase family protein, partial [methanotrophic bacterial endosymbiont of Bathymodiolus sp.]